MVAEERESDEAKSEDVIAAFCCTLTDDGDGFDFSHHQTIASTT